MSSAYNLTSILDDRKPNAVYVNLFTLKHLAIDLFTNNSYRNQDSTLIICSNKETFISGLTNNNTNNLTKTLNNNIKKQYFIEHDVSLKNISAIDIIEDICKIRFQKNNLVTIFIPDISLTSNIKNHTKEYVLNVFFEKLNQLAHKHKLTIQLFIYGSHCIKQLKPALLSMNDKLAGLCSIIILNDKTYNYTLEFFTTPSKIYAKLEYQLSSLSNNSISAQLKTDSNHEIHLKEASDQQQLFCSQDALQHNDKLPEDTILTKDNQDLLQLLDQVQAATIIFSCTNQGQVQQLAIDCFHLRKKAGSQLKILIRELKPCLRYADEKFLLRAGVNLISHSQIPFVRFMSQIEAVQDQVLQRSLPNNTMELLEYNQKFELKGYLTNHDFVDYCHQILTKSSQSDVRFALVQLNLLPEMKAEECLRLCHIRREGDVITASKKALYVLFGAIRSNDTNIALNNIFEFPVQDLFHSTQTFDTHYDIDVILQHINQHQITIDNDVSNLTTEQNIFTYHNDAKSTQAAPQYAIKKAFKIKSLI